MNYKNMQFYIETIKIKTNKSHCMNSTVVRRWQIIESLNLRTEKQNVCNHGPVEKQ